MLLYFTLRGKISICFHFACVTHLWQFGCCWLNRYCSRNSVGLLGLKSLSMHLFIFHNAKTIDVTFESLALLVV